MVRDNPIKDAMDANWYLYIAEDLSEVLPIDEVVEMLCEKGTIGTNVDQAKLEARRATWEAWSSASRALSIHRTRQEDKRSHPKELLALAKKVKEMLEIYDDIVSSLHTQKSRTARQHLEHLIASRYSDKRKEGMLAFFDHTWHEFSTVGNILRDSYRWLNFGRTLIKPKKGRPKEFPVFFVNQLSSSWVKLTGSVPVRSHDAYSGRETGDFHAYCKAAAAKFHTYTKLVQLMRRSGRYATHGANREWRT